MPGDARDPTWPIREWLAEPLENRSSAVAADSRIEHLLTAYDAIARERDGLLRVQDGMRAEINDLSDRLSAAEDALPTGYQTDAEHGLVDCISDLRARLAALEQENAGLRAELAEKARDADGHGLEQDVVKAAMALFTNDGRLAGHGHLPPLKAAVARLREELEPRP